jgi:hypothetical protein
MPTYSSSSLFRGVCAAVLIPWMLLATACDSSTEPAPPEVIAIVDGRAWSANANADHPFAIADGSTLELRAVRAETIENGDLATSTITITIADFHGIGQYALGGTSPNRAVYSYRIEPSGVSYATAEDATGQLTIGAIDARGAWVSGSFQFEARDAHSSSIAVREGQFIGRLVGY